MAQSLLPSAVDRVASAGSGANSHVYRVECEGAVYALKQYPRLDKDPRPRQETEWRALTFMRLHGMENVPRAIKRSDDGRFTLLDWVEGRPIDKYSDDDLTALIRFVIGVFKLSEKEGAQDFGPASEACLSTEDIIVQVSFRLRQLRDVPFLGDFIEGNLRTAFEYLSARTKRSRTAGAVVSQHRRLVPADTGFHNALRQRHTGRLVFLDFDYFGWDDPVKLASDIMLHPAMLLEKHEAIRVAMVLGAAVPEDRAFRDRLQDRLKLLALRWALIVLKPFAAAAGAVSGAEFPAVEIERRLALANQILDAADKIWASLE